VIGQELGGRYELLARIGGGGMAVVYKAHDQLLNRYVAIKVLRQQFVHDEDFIRRFRREAQSAASLSHPNVVSIYDVGQEADTHYIVMEYVEGRNLNEIIKERAPLQVEEAVNIASQICDALDHAHQNGIIHRDIKPHNILIGRNGRVKVTDFGIARAVTSSDITQTGSVIGSVHYFSPEQARGASQGEKSDLYSLGIVLYQMLTNRLPFLGESPISVALKHLQEQVVDPRSVNPYIPQSVENIILKALRKNPNERYQSARQMLNDLERALLPDRLNEPKITFAPQDEYGTGRVDEQPTRVMPAIRGNAVPQSGVSTGRAGAGKTPVRGNAVPQSSAVAAEPEEEDDAWDPVREKRRFRWVKPVSWLLVTALLLAGMWYGVRYVQKLITIPDVPVPSVVGLPIDEARDELQKAGFNSTVLKREYNDEFPKDTVISQDREPGMTANEGTVIGLTVSYGPKTERMGNYVGKPLADALRDLENLGIEASRIVTETVESEEAAGTVLRQSPDPLTEFVVSRVEIAFVVSGGPGTFEMPSLINDSEATAISKLVQLKLKEKIVREPSYAVPEGYVFQHHPQPGDPVAPGEEVVLYISTGMPADARQADFPIELRPRKSGENSVFEIRVSDARGENLEWGTRETSTPIIVTVPIVVSPTKSAAITVWENNSVYNHYTISYQDAVAAQETLARPTPGSDGANRDAPAGEPDGEQGDGADARGEAEAPADGEAEAEGGTDASSPQESDGE
jgi:serine/threonine-protein kinase